METSWKWKFGSVFAFILLGLYALVPTLFHFPQIRQELEAQKKEGTEALLPWYFKFFPEKGINLGLDLQGGIYIELEVMVEEGLKAKMDILAQEIIRNLKERKQLEVESSAKDPAYQYLDFTFKTPEDSKAASEYLLKNYRNTLKREESLPGEKPAVRYFLSPQYLADLQKDVVSQAVQAVRNRIDRYGLAEPTVQRQGATRIVVELPGVKDPERAIKIIQQAGKLEFKLVKNDLTATKLGDMIAEARKTANLAVGYTAEDVQKLNDALADKLPKESEVAFDLTREAVTGKITQATPYLLERTVYVTGEMLKNAQVQFDQNSKPYVSLTFNSDGAKNFGDLTTAHVHELLAIMLDGNIASAPQIREPIRNGQCQITLGSSSSRDAMLREAKDLVLVLQEGALPARLKEATKTVIGPTLGADSIQKSIRSMLFGTLLVIIFMVIYYNLSGLLADAAVLINTIFIFALLAMFQATLTLPGMAGIVLTIGMAVDTNVLILERIREELAVGQHPRAAVESGYRHAMRAIIDSHLTVIISGIILYQYGTGPIRGFAVTLMIGLICNLFTAVTMTKMVYDYFIMVRKINRISI